MLTFDDDQGQRVTNYPVAFQELVSMLVELAGSRGEAAELLAEGLRGSRWDNPHD